MLGLPIKNISEVGASGPSQFLFTVSYVLFCFYFILGSRFSQNWADFAWQRQNFSLGHMEEGKKHLRMRRGMRHRSSKHPILIAQELA